MPTIKLLESEDALPSGYTPATRIDYLDFTDASLHDFIKEHCEKNGKPLVVSNFHKSTAWDEELFTLEKLKSLNGDMSVEFTFKRNGEPVKKSLLFSDYIDDIQRQYNLHSAKYSEKTAVKLKAHIKKLYAKDVDCPLIYRETINNIIPDYLLPQGHNDLFSYTPERFRAENFMCYLGRDGTGTPLHRDLCGTMGHNIMVSGTPGGYAEWVIVENQYRDRLAEVLKPTVTELRNVYETEEINGIASKRLRSKRKKRSVTASNDGDNKGTNGRAMTKNSFLESDRAWLIKETVKSIQVPVHVIIQKPGDLVLIPSRAYHQVRNKGACLKIAWNRITPQTLIYAFEDQLPLYKIINRPETYKCKGLVACAVKAWNERLSVLIAAKESSRTAKAAENSIFKCGFDDFKRNAKILSDLLLNKVIAPELLYDDHVNGIISDSNDEICSVRCDFCYSDVFHRYYHCEICNQYDLCMDCFSLGRSCQHPADMKMHQSCEDLMAYVELYRNFVDNLNHFFQEDVIEAGLEEQIVHLTANNASNLATTCRRIEQYRCLRLDSFNALDCSHCGATTDVLKLANSGVSLSSIFQRGPCQSLQAVKKNETVLKVYVCGNCVSECQSCLAFSKRHNSLVDFDLVYYVHPRFDYRNKGGFIDSNLPKTCEGYCGPATKRPRTMKTQQATKSKKKAKTK